MLKKLTPHFPQILKIGVYLTLFTSLLYPYRDKDWGWHYKYGEYLLTHGHLLIRDIYSWTLSTYAWINHSWLYDPLLYFLYNHVGYLGLSIVSALIAIICFHLLTKDFTLNYWQLGITAFFFSKLLETGIGEGLRSQVLALLPLSMLMYLLKKTRSDAKFLNWIPPLFLVWVNLHGSFAYGLAIVGVFFFCYFFEFKQYRKKLISIGLLTILMTMFNPFTYHSYLEVIRHTSNPYLQNVYEWLPIYDSCLDCNVPSFSIYLVILLFALVIKHKVEDLPYLIILFALGYQTITHRRYLPIFAISTLPLFLTFITNLKYRFLDLSRYKITTYLSFVLLLVTLEYNLLNRLPSYNFYTYTERDFCKQLSPCPYDTINYLLDNPPAGKGFNFYDWGGYMIGKGFPAKLFLDGRMHLWSVRGYTPFGDYIKMYYSGDVALFKEYDFDWILVQQGSLITQLIDEGKVGKWRLAYYDENGRYYVRVR